MFVLSRIRDSVKILPANFNDNVPDALREAINERYANKVIHDVGLCICLYQINAIGDAHIFPGDASAYYKVEFQALVFRPFKNEVVRGRIKSSSETGVTVSVGFFDDIVIPSSFLRHPSAFDKEEQVWVWHCGGEDKLFLDVGHSVNVLIDRLVFSKTYAIQDPASDVEILPSVNEDFGAADTNDEIELLILEARKRTPMLVIATIDKDGLGCTDWWDEEDDEDEDEDETSDQVEADADAES